MAIGIVCSAADKASQNIKHRLFELASWDPCLSRRRLWKYKHFRLLEVEGRFVDHYSIEQDLNADLLIFASRHQSEARKEPLITVHFTGDICTEKEEHTNGNSLACAAPFVLKLLAVNLKRRATVGVVMEATHHGPYALETPSLFVEIGSSEYEWHRQDLGMIVARAILDLGPKVARHQCASAVGFGGPHYAVRHTDVLLRTDVCFGHVFSTRQLRCLNEKRINQAFNKSNAQFAYFDKKSAGKYKQPIERVVRALGYDVLRLVDIRERKNIPWDVYLHIRSILRQNGIAIENRHIRVSLTFQRELSTATTNVNLQLNELHLDRFVMKEVQKIDHGSLRRMIEIERVVYLESVDGTISAIFAPADLDALAIEKALLERCVAILKQRYEVEYLPSQSKLYIATRKFDPRLAESLGVSQGPLFAKLARGESIKVDDKVIKPEDVFTRVKKVIDLTHA
ncbi:MAG: D-aminoacyl-tRNA deacylase [Halobacteriota archaeon]